MSKIGFEFPIDGSGQWDGFNDPGMEHFTGNRLQHLGREVPQNTIDAKVSLPAKIKVGVRKVPVSSIPGLNDLKTAFEKCAEAALGEDSEKAVKFFQSATKIINSKDVFVLQLRDSNTTGLLGPCENGKPYFAMMKATGQSKKLGTSTGSYGIGKFAPFTKENRAILINSIYFGAVMQCLSLLKKDNGSIEYRWAEIFRQRLSDQSIDIDNHDEVWIAQQLMRHPISIIDQYFFGEKGE